MLLSLPSASRRLDEEGFEMGSFVRRHKFKWTDVAGFRIGSIHGAKMIAFWWWANLTRRGGFSGWLVQRGRTLKEVQEALGHQTITMTVRSSHLAPDYLRATVAVLDGVLSSSESEPTKVSAQGSAQEPVAISGVSAN